MNSSQATGDNSYDQLPYNSHPYERTHPDHLATMGQLFGLSPTHPDRCRVLEIGCAAGGNLIPLAVAMPDAEFLGFDLSGRAIEDGNRLISRLGLSNIRLEQHDIRNFSAPAESFDYIICHGVFSWVPAEVRQRIFELCRESLTPHGIAYISYNTYPGWFMRGMVREMLCFHARQFTTPHDQIQQARALLDFLHQSASQTDPTYHLLLKRELEILQSREDSYLYHEHLEQDNEPVFFYQFMEQATEHGLRFLCETQFSEMLPTQFDAATAQTLQRLSPDIVHAEQYLDFLRNRQFRRTLLCHADRELQRNLGQQQLTGMWLRTSLRSGENQAPMDQPGPHQFTSPQGLTVTLEDPLLKLALTEIIVQTPRYVLFDDLLTCDRVASVLSANPADSQQAAVELASLCLQLLTQDLLELRCVPARFATDWHETLKPSPLVLEQMQSGELVTNLRHQQIRLSEIDKLMIDSLHHDRPTRRDQLRQQIDDGTIKVSVQTGQSPADDPSPNLEPVTLTDDQLDQLIGHADTSLLRRALLR